MISSVNIKLFDGKMGGWTTWKTDIGGMRILKLKLKKYCVNQQIQIW
jgi:hypothetical protein